jgi:hypothetical protein
VGGRPPTWSALPLMTISDIALPTKREVTGTVWSIQLIVDKPRTLAGRDRAAGDSHPGDFDWLPAGAVAHQISLRVAVLNVPKN